MAQTENAGTSSAKRTYRKGSPLSAVARQQTHVAKKKATHKELRVYVENELKDELQVMCDTYGVTQSVMIERLIKEASLRSTDNVTD